MDDCLFCVIIFSINTIRQKLLSKCLENCPAIFVHLKRMILVIMDYCRFIEFTLKKDCVWFYFVILVLMKLIVIPINQTLLTCIKLSKTISRVSYKGLKMFDGLVFDKFNCITFSE